MNGLYLNLHAYMLRIAIPYGELSSKQLGRFFLLRINMTEVTVISQQDKIFSLIAQVVRVPEILRESRR